MIGQTFSHYRILRILGEGGMGVVYEAEDVRLGRHVALKFIVHQALDRRESVERFEREARAASVLNHPNICTVHDVGEEGGHHFIAMELLEGEGLEAMLSRGPLPVRQILDLGIQVAEGLAAAHARHVIHRDIKPANVFVTTAGFAKIMDFGLAKILQSAAAESLTTLENEVTKTSGLTTPGMTMGTVSFMSPEHARGEEVDARADLFAFGSLLYAMGVGEPPFRGPTPAVTLAGILERAPVPPRARNPALPPKLEDVILKALEKNREDRYQTARDMANDLRRILRELDSGTSVTTPTRTDSGSGAWSAASRPQVAAAPPAAEGKRPERWIAALGIAVVLGAGAFLLWKSRGEPAKPASAAAAPRQFRSIAVLPLENLSADPSQEYLADGMTDELIAKLSKISALRVISRTSAMRYKDSKKSLPEIAKDLHVDAVVEGSVMQQGDRVRINARLTDVASDTQLWAEGYERDLKDVLGLQSEVASAIVRGVRVEVAPEETRQLARASTVDPEAYQLYLQGRVAYFRFTPESLARAAEYFHRAIAKDPRYALAYQGLADAYIQLAGRVRPPRETMPKALAAIERARELDPDLAEVHTSLGQVRLFYEFDFEGAASEFATAIEMNPRSSVIRHVNGLFLAAQGRHPEALADADRVIDIDPASPASGCLRTRLLYYARRYDDAIAQYEKTVQADPTVAGFCTFGIFAYQKLGRFDEAIAAAKRISESSPNEMLPRSALARSYGVMGNREDAEKTVRAMEELGRRRFISEHDFALARSGWDREGTLRWLQKAYEARAGLLVYANVDSVWDEVREDPRFQGIVAKVGIPR